jgi:BirA family transcriptional regulator, biotin operon repressor / biotin---[acetyl-CoA-carboxylase] ligase
MTYQTTDRRIDRLLHLLVENATVVLPGPKIAAEIGVSRYKVRSWIDKLRRLGVEVQGHSLSGYQLRKLPDVLSPTRIRAEIGDCEIGNKILHYFVVDSTNTAAMELAAQGAPHGTVVLAEEQTGGRGRFGRTWYSEKASGIYSSVILRPVLPPSAAPILTLMAGLATRQAIINAAEITPDIRWPNDLLVNGKKAAGILTEMNAEMDRVHAVVLGIGLNVNHSEMPSNLQREATSLRIESKRIYSRVHLMAALLRQIQTFYELLLSRGAAEISRQWAAASTFASGKRVRVSTKGGYQTATTLGLEPSGALRVRFDDGQEQFLFSGDVVEVKEAISGQRLANTYQPLDRGLADR